MPHRWHVGGDVEDDMRKPKTHYCGDKILDESSHAACNYPLFGSIVICADWGKVTCENCLAERPGRMT